jgi:hypothetical protein
MDKRQLKGINSILKLIIIIIITIVVIYHFSSVSGVAAEAVCQNHRIGIKDT